MLSICVRRLLASFALVLLAACGGGASPVPGDATNAAASSTVSSDSAPSGASPGIAASLSGSIVKGPVAGAQVCVYALVPTGKGNLLGCTTSNTDGTYALNLAFEGAVVVEATGGSYTDEATGLTGVQLGTPLQSVTTLGRGTNLLHATPLTALAFRQALATGGMSQAEFQAKADVVRGAFGLPPDVDLARTLPTVAVGSVNPYGKALHDLSKMLGMGATLGGIIGNDDLDALKASFKSVEQCVTQAPVANNPPPSGVLGAGQIKWITEPLPQGGLLVSVVNPASAWRSLLPANGAVMGCDLAANSAASVTLSCPTAALQADFAALAGTYAQNAPTPALPLTGVLAMGEKIQLQGALNFGGNLTLSSDAMDVGSATINVSGNLTINSPGTGTSVVGNLCIKMIGLTAAGIPKTGSAITLGGAVGGSVNLQTVLPAPSGSQVALSPGAVTNVGAAQLRGTLVTNGGSIQAAGLNASGNTPSLAPGNLP